MVRLPRLAIAVLPGLDHFIPDLARALEDTGALSVRVFVVRGPADVGAILAWTDRPERDAVWFEFCWPPFPALIAATDFAGRKVVVRVHRIEAYGSDHVAGTDWSRVSDVVVVGADMAARLREAAPEIDHPARVRVIHNGLDLDRFVPLASFDPYRIGWCGWFSLHKNPILALEILHRLRRRDPRYTLRISSKGGEQVAVDAFGHLARRLGLEAAIQWDGAIGPDSMPAWHAGNAVLLSTSVYESFGYAIAEAAACGCDLAILDNTAAAEFWPEATRFASVAEAVAIIRAAAPHRWRGLVAERFSIRLQAQRIVGFLDRPAPGFDSAQYWENRYRAGGTSGSGSHGRLARYKADTLNALVRRHNIGSVVEFGCGDGAQLALAAYPSYVGVDVSPTALALCRKRFEQDAAKRFLPAGDGGIGRADMALSLDVIFHLVEQDVFDRYMRALFDAALRFVVIYGSDREQPTPDPHVRHRAFSRWIGENAQDWRRVERGRNPYPFDPGRPDDTSFCEFQIFERSGA